MTNKRILVVEDDADVRLGYHIRLKANGYDVFFATDATSSISEARKHQPDLIIVDLGVPGGDGFIVIERLKANIHLAVVPIIVVSARDRYQNKDRALQAGANAFLQKPVDDNELLAIIRQLLGESTKPERSEVHDLGSL